MIKTTDAARKTMSDPPTRPEMIRRALVQWLEMTGSKS
ncbi:hypothetical protein PY32053_01249 [Paracoccus yeei]|uniref:Ribbon-helix-helix protein CopG domain-containing protein n=1 Tax=Paracoccus yeei TaxID=147645 RepID=A0A386UJN4_9RHOB|nr:hypothetical protein PY32053_01249 [Paracoccus yeei]